MRSILPSVGQKNRRLQSASIKILGGCFYCGTPIGHAKKKDQLGQTTKDHLTPRCRNGSNLPWNIVKACKSCNQLKGCLNLEEFRLVIAYRKGFVKAATMRFYGELPQPIALLKNGEGGIHLRD
jgi:hypothetical protein